MAEYVLPYTSQEVEDKLTKVGTIGDVATENILPIEKGGTGAITTEQALLNLGGTSMELLWENAFTQNDFTPQTLNIGSSNYSHLGIIFVTNAMSPATRLLEIRIIENIDNRTHYLGWANIWNF